MKVKDEIDKLEELLLIPISNIDFSDKTVRVFSNTETSILDTGFKKNDNEISYDTSDSRISQLNWQQIVDQHEERIRAAINQNYNLGPYKLVPDSVYRISTYNDQNVSLCSFICHYKDKEWIIKMDAENEILNLKKIFIKSNGTLKANQSTQELILSSQNQMLEKAIDIGGKLYEIYLDKKITYDKHEIKLLADFEKKELEVINKLDKRDKWFKGAILIACIAGLILSAILEVATSVAPILGVIIGLILKNNAISEYFGGSAKKKNTQNNMIEED